MRVSLACLVACSSLAVAQIEVSQCSCGYPKQILQLPSGSPLCVGYQKVDSLYTDFGSSQRLQISIGPGAYTIGGTGNDIPLAAATDPKGNVWIVGTTDSDDFPLVNPIVAHKVPYRAAAFVLELDPTRNRVLFATYLAGQKTYEYAVPDHGSSATAIAFDAGGNAYVGGSTDEPDFPVTPGALLGGKAGMYIGSWLSYSFLVKISPTGQLLYSTELRTGISNCKNSNCNGPGGTTFAGVSSVLVDSTGSPTVAGTFGGAASAGAGYVLRLAPDFSRLVWTKDIGVTFDVDVLKAVRTLFIAPDLSPTEASLSPGRVNLFGSYALITRFGQVSGFTVTPVQYGTSGLFAAQLDGDGSTYTYSADLGQASDANAFGMTSDSEGRVYLAGTSSSPRIASGDAVPSAGPDFFLTLDRSGSLIRSPLHLPRGAVSVPPALSESGHLWPLGDNGSLLRIPADYNFDPPVLLGYANAASRAFDSGLYPGALVTLFGFGFRALSQDLQVLVNGTAAPILSTSPTEIEVQVPFSSRTYLNNPAATIQVVAPNGTLKTEFPPSETIGIFTTDGIHAAALNFDGTVNSPDSPAPSGSVVTLFGTGAIWPPAMSDGVIADGPMPLSQARNRFEVFDWNGVPLTILYAGAAPGMIIGVFQINVQLASAAPFGRPAKLTLNSSPSDRALFLSHSVQIYAK